MTFFRQWKRLDRSSIEIHVSKLNRTYKWIHRIIMPILRSSIRVQNSCKACNEKHKGAKDIQFKVFHANPILSS